MGVNYGSVQHPHRPNSNSEGFCRQRYTCKIYNGYNNIGEYEKASSDLFSVLIFLLCKCILISLVHTHISPVDLLHRGRYRLIYAAIFGLMSNTFLSLGFGGPKLCTSGNPYGVVFCNVGMLCTHPFVK